MSSSRILKGAALGLLLAPLAGTPLLAQDIETCNDVMRFVEREDYRKALEEATWCQRAIQELHYQKIASILERTIEGMEPGDPSIEAAMGISMVEITYRGDGNRVRLQITSGTGAAAAAASGLGALANMASAFGVRADGQRQVRVAGMTGMLEEDGDDVKLTLTMDGGMILTLEGEDREILEAVVDAIIDDLEDYLG